MTISLLAILESTVHYSDYFVVHHYSLTQYLNSDLLFHIFCSTHPHSFPSYSTPIRRLIKKIVKDKPTAQ